MSLEGKSPDEIAALAELADSVLSKPDTAGVFQRLVKKNNPEVSMPFIDLEDKAVAAFKERDDRINELSGKLQQSEAEKQANALYESLKDSGHVQNRAGFSKLVTYASENGFMTTEQGLKKAAMSLQLEMEAAEPTPATVGNGLFSLGTDEDSAKGFMKNPQAHARSLATQAMNEIIKARGKGKAFH